MKKLLTILLTLILALGICFSFTACGTVEDVKAIKEKGKIIVGITDYEPMDFQDETGKWIGFDAELAEKFAAELGVECEFFVIVDWDNKVLELNSNNIDVVWNGMTASEKLGKEIDFSVSYAKNAQVAVVKKGSTITANQVETSTIAVEKGSAGDITATEWKGATINRVGNQKDALMEVQAGESDVAIVDITMAQSIVGRDDFADLQVVAGAEYGEEVFAVGLRKGSDLKAKLDAFLKEQYKNGTMTELATKYIVGLNEEALSK